MAEAQAQLGDDGMQRVAARRASGLCAQAETKGTARGLHSGKERGPPMVRVRVRVRVRLRVRLRLRGLGLDLGLGLEAQA